MMKREIYVDVHEWNEARLREKGGSRLKKLPYNTV